MAACSAGDEGRSAIRIESAGDEAAQHAILQQLIQNGIRVQSFNEVQTDLEEIFHEGNPGHRVVRRGDRCRGE